jgi:hypothetical protein
MLQDPSMFTPAFHNAGNSYIYSLHMMEGSKQFKNQQRV